MAGSNKANTGKNDENSRPLFIKQIQNTKMGKLLVFILLFTFIFKVINYILSFFDIGQELAYTYIIWLMILFFFFVLLPLNRSYIFMPSPSSSKEPNGAVPSDGDGAGAGGGAVAATPAMGGAYPADAMSTGGMGSV